MYRLFVFLMLAASGLLSGCAQDPNKVVISVGRGLNAFEDGVPPDGNEARDYATLYLPYAVMAELANGFDKNNSLNEKSGCPVLSNQLYLANWRCIGGWMDEIPSDKGSGTTPVPGLGVFLWQRNGCDFAVVFRGTNPTELADWKANLRALLPFSLTEDQYDLVIKNVRYVLNPSRRCGSRRTVVMVGHSLGGGLAQAAAFATPDTRYVFAFDSSPVTTWTEQNAGADHVPERNLAIDRVYEVGEILQAVRFVLHGFSNPRSCQPRTRLVRFNYTRGWAPLGQHGIEALKKSFIDLSGATAVSGPTGDWKAADGKAKARTCDYQGDFRNDPYRVR
jgi:pimeloyl-ACP methyl ester carboxylesterase